MCVVHYFTIMYEVNYYPLMLYNFVGIDFFSVARKKTRNHNNDSVKNLLDAYSRLSRRENRLQICSRIHNCKLILDIIVFPFYISVYFYFQAISIFLMALIVHMQNGGESTQMYNPFFEANLRGKLSKQII